MKSDRTRMAVYWASSCGGCEVALLNLHERLLDLDERAEIVFCPFLVDTRTRDVEAMPDGSIAFTLFNGAMRTTENVEMARLLRRKSAVLVAFGSCAHEGCIPGLANLGTRAQLLSTVFGPHAPQPETAVADGVLSLPPLLERVRCLADVVEVDYVVPGCPPEPHQIQRVVERLLQPASLPPRGAVLGAGTSSVCEECARPRADKRVDGLRRTFEIDPDPQQCLLDQGIVCMGPATRDGCGALCLRVNMPCTGCYGAPDGVIDQGAKMASTLGSILDVEPLKRHTEEEVMAIIDARLDALPDPCGTLYRYGLAGSPLSRS